MIFKSDQIMISSQYSRQEEGCNICNTIMLKKVGVSSHGRYKKQRTDSCPLLPGTEGEGAPGQDLRKAIGLGRRANGLVGLGIGQCHGDRRPQV